MKTPRIFHLNVFIFGGNILVVYLNRISFRNKTPFPEIGIIGICATSCKTVISDCPNKEVRPQSVTLVFVVC